MKKGKLARGECADCRHIGALRQSDGKMLPHFCGARGYRSGADAITLRPPPGFGRMPDGMMLLDTVGEIRAYGATATEARRRADKTGMPAGVTMALRDLAKWCDLQIQRLAGTAQEQP